MQRLRHALKDSYAAALACNGDLLEHTLLKVQLYKLKVHA